jgi:hypothetical protein
MKVIWEHTRRLELEVDPVALSAWFKQERKGFDGSDEEFARDTIEEFWTISDVDGCTGEEGVRIVDEDSEDHLDFP